MRTSFSVPMTGCLLALAAVTTACATGTRVSVAAREGVVTRFDYQAAPDPVAQVVLFEGGTGRIGSGRGFLERSRALFAGRNITSALFEPPSDQPEGLLGSYRSSGKHVLDVDATVAWMRERDPAPVWLVGVSLGTQSVTWLGSRLKQPVAGLVFASSPTVGRSSVAERGLDRIRAPSLIVHHKRDACYDTPASGVETFERLLPVDTKREIRLFDGGSDAGSDPCKSGFHLYSGIENQVLTAIADFIVANSTR